MFSKAEFRRFLDQLLRFERQAIRAYSGILRDLEDEDLRKTFQSLLDVEHRHKEMVKGLEDLL